MIKNWLTGWKPFAIVVAIVLIALAAASFPMGWRNLWLTPDQRGRLLFDRGRPAAAAMVFRNALWRGIAQFRAGDFKAAERTFAGIDTAEAAYDQGNALIFLGKYDDAVARYDHALSRRPGWQEAQANRDIARIRAQRMKMQGGETEDGEKADALVYDKTKKGGQDITVEGDKADMTDQAIRALWLKRVQTRPADFLKARFTYQLQAKPDAGAAVPAGPKP